MSEAVDIIHEAERAQSLLSPLRLQVLEALREPGSATTVAATLGLPRQKVNYHLRTLERHGLVEHVRDRQRRGTTERIMRSTARHYLIAPSVLGALEARPERTPDQRSSAHLAAVSARTLSEVAELRRRAAAVGKRLPTFTLETAVRFRNAGEQAAFAEELANTVARLAAKYHDDSADGGRWFRLAVGAHPALTPPGSAADETGDTDD